MNWSQTFKKGAYAVLTFVTAYIIANPGAVTHLIPASISQMTVGSAVAALAVMASNWYKNKNTPPALPAKPAA